MIVDSHMHIYPVPAWGRRRTGDHPITEYGPGEPEGRSTEPGDVGSALRALRRAGVDGAVALNLYEPERIRDDTADLPPGIGPGPGCPPGEYLAWLDGWLLDATLGTPLWPVIAADPLAMPGAAIGRHVREMAARGACGVKLHHASAGLIPADPAFDDLYAACVDAGLPLIAHTGSSVPLAAMAPVATRWPGLVLVLAHLGGSGWRDAAAFAATHRTVLFDLAELLWWVGAPGAPTEPELLAVIEGIGPERVLFGSDFPWYEPADGVALIQRLGLSTAATAAVLGDNATRVFGLARPALPV